MVKKKKNSITLTVSTLKKKIFLFKWNCFLKEENFQLLVHFFLFFFFLSFIRKFIIMIVFNNWE